MTEPLVLLGFGFFGLISWLAACKITDELFRL